MTVTPILKVALVEEVDIVVARLRARQIAALLGFETQDQTRIATAVSEIARNACSYGGGGRAEFRVDDRGEPKLLVTISDHGPGIADLDAILEGRFKSDTGMGVGIIGTRRLMDSFDVESSKRGTKIVFGKSLPKGHPRLSSALFSEIGKVLAASGPADPAAEVRTQNQELLQSLAELKVKQDEAQRLNAELEETNRGVVALYAELDKTAAELSSLNMVLASRVAAAVAECQQANDKLRQSQKMEAVGQLTGGIAHDFNNLLQIVTGNLEMVQIRLPQDAERLHRAVGHAMSGARRAAVLTQRLLSFSRRQPLSPKPIEPNGLVDGMSDLMRRTLGEGIGIDIRLADDLWLVEADANQLENAVLNLAVNARDAMGSGGTLTITTTNGVVGEAEADEEAKPGQYVSLSVCDTGAGMSEDTLARVLEPFFTTKPVGKGTGLGLSMVYGFVKQSGGHLRIESTVGRGTTVIINLPRWQGVMPDEADEALIVIEPALPGEAVLVVEDDGDVRAFMVEILTEHGYRILEASDGPTASAIIEAPGRLDLVLSDVVLSGPTNGREIANLVARQRPYTPVLLTTGYASQSVFADAELGAGVEFLAKPFTVADLLGRVRRAIVQGRQAQRNSAFPSSG